MKRAEALTSPQLRHGEGTFTRMSLPKYMQLLAELKLAGHELAACLPLPTTRKKRVKSCTVRLSQVKTG